MIELSPTRYNDAIRINYQQAIDKLIKEMFNDINKQIAESYKYNIEDIKDIAQDADPVGRLRLTINFLIRKWKKIFNEKSIIIVNKFIDNIDNNNKSVVQFSIKEALPTFKINMSSESRAILNTKKAVIQENINLIKSIPEQYMQRVSNLVFSSLSRGRGLTNLRNGLINIQGVTRRRAKLIAGDQMRKTTSVINNTRYLDLGFTKAKWNHSHAGKVPRPGHVAADGEIYDIRKGCFIDGEWIQVGEKINCRCFSTVVIE